MPALAPYIPPKDADLVTWADNFRDLIVANPAQFGLVAGDATAISTVVDAWDAAYATAVNPSTRTPTTVQAKNDAKTTMLAIVRPYAQQISLNAGVTSDDKIAVGVNPRTSTPSPIAAPTSNPVIGLRGGSPLSLTLQYTDSAAPTGKAKPYGVKFIEVRAATSATPITDPNLIPYYGTFSKSPLILMFGSADANKTCYIACRWMNGNGAVGPWSNIDEQTIMQA